MMVAAATVVNEARSDANSNSSSSLRSEYSVEKSLSIFCSLILRETPSLAERIIVEISDFTNYIPPTARPR